jgi:hypothetical protein
MATVGWSRSALCNTEVSSATNSTASNADSSSPRTPSVRRWPVDQKHAIDDMIVHHSIEPGHSFPGKLPLLRVVTHTVRPPVKSGVARSFIRDSKRNDLPSSLNWEDTCGNGRRL